MKPRSTATYKTVRGLSRGLEVLNALNRESFGVTPTQLASITGLHRTTVRRLLETLQSEGYVRCSPSDNSYSVTMRVRELGDGFQNEQWISEVATPMLGELLNKVVWPTDIATLDNDAMVIRETTHLFSRLSFHRSMVGRRLPLLQTAMGLAYIAFCPDNERNKLIKLLSTHKTLEGEIARNPERLNSLILRTRRKGFGENFMNWRKEEKIAAIALPIMSGEKVLACLSLVYIAEAMTIDQAVEKHLPAMLCVRDKIEHALVEKSTP